MLSQLINTGDERAELQAALRWDYSQLGDAAATVIEHTIEIKRNERRANDAVVSRPPQNAASPGVAAAFHLVWKIYFEAISPAPRACRQPARRRNR